MTPQPRRLLIAVEGCDGTGKSTLVARLASELQLGHGLPTRTLKRPAPNSAAARAFLEPVPECDAEPPHWISSRDQHLERLRSLMDADCADTLSRRIPQAHADGAQVVILDRHYLSAAIYQGGSDWQGEHDRQRARWGEPDLWVICTAHWSVARARIARRVGDHDAATPGPELASRLAKYEALAQVQRSPVLVVDTTDDLTLRRAAPVVLHLPNRAPLALCDREHLSRHLAHFAREGVWM